jgi:hypothetical protein
MLSESEAGHSLCGSSAAPRPNVVETARKRAALLAEVVSHLARCHTTLSKLTDFERRHRNSDRANGVGDIHLSLNDLLERFGVDADDAHAEWNVLRQRGEMVLRRP